MGAHAWAASHPHAAPQPPLRPHPRRQHLPPPAIYFVPSDAPDAAAHCEALKGQLPQPPLVARELALPPKDPMFVKFYVLLHDAAAPGADEAK